MSVEYITRSVFNTVITDSGYDNMDLFTAAGAFMNLGLGVSYIPSILLAALIVKDRPISSYFFFNGRMEMEDFL